jgi:hypothetical protein
MKSSHQSLNSNSKAKIEKLNCWKHGPDGRFQDICNFIKVDFGHDPKTSFDPYLLFSHIKNLPKY